VPGTAAAQDLAYRHRYVEVDGVRTHYLEAGEGPDLVLLHGGEFGACAELSWRHNIGALAERFHVYAPDLLGYGETEKLHSFTAPSDFRVRHLAAFLRTLCIERAHFVGNSYGGSLLLRVATTEPLAWPVDRIVLVSAGGHVPVNEHREALLSYDGSFEGMRRILQILFYDEAFYADERVAEWHESSLRPGAWEALAAARLAPPGREQPWRAERAAGACRRPTLIVAGAEDLLREPGYAEELAETIPGSRAEVFPCARHCPHIEHAERFNELALSFLSAGSVE
jgi:pimeloyl-ACP methyl ester carboxylesterase